MYICSYVYNTIMMFIAIHISTEFFMLRLTTHTSVGVMKLSAFNGIRYRETNLSKS